MNTFTHNSRRLSRLQMHQHLGEAPITTPPAADPNAPGTNAFDQLVQEAGPSEEVGYYVFNQTLTANQSLPNLTQFIDGDSDFVLVSIHGKSTGSYNINIKDNALKPLYSSDADSTLVVGTAQLPCRIRPALFYPAAGKIGISLTDTSGAPNTVQLVFTGVKKFRTS